MTTIAPTRQRLRFMWLEITGKCQLECSHCYASSGPAGTHGRMTGGDWHRVIEDAARLGVDQVQFIGGEPTLHPALPSLIGHALAHRVAVEVFSNLVHVTPAMWTVLAQPGVSLATSWYSDDALEHTTITRRPSHTRTAVNIAEAVRRGIPLRVGIIGGILPGQRVDQAEQTLLGLGVDPDAIGVDHLRQVGRGIRDQTPSVDQLCGNCADGVLAVSPSGEVWPCVFSRWMPVGNVLHQPLAEILDGPVAAAREELRAAFQPAQMPCVPRMCNPECGPHCGPACIPTKCGPNGCNPTNQCQPKYTCGPCAPKDQCCQPDKTCKPNDCRPTKR